MDRLTMAQETLWSDLKQRSLDAMFDAKFPENGNFVMRSLKGRSYYYYVGYRTTSGGETPAKQFSKYVGPADDPDILAQVRNFSRIKAGYKERRDLVRSLSALGLTTPPAFVGDVVEALWKAGVFRLRGILVGTAAFQTYAGSMGVRFPLAASMTGDVDLAQFRAVSMAVDDSTPPLIEPLQAIDPTFTSVPHQMRGSPSVAFQNDKGFRVELLTPLLGSDEFGRQPFKLPAMAGASAQPLRFLDFLLHQPVRSILLHKGGIPVTVPAPERFCVHKMIVSQRRNRGSQDKSSKDLMQAGLLLEAADLTGALVDFGYAWIEACERGPKWHEALADAERRMDTAAKRRLGVARIEACRDKGSDLQTFEMPP